MKGIKYQSKILENNKIIYKSYLFLLSAPSKVKDKFNKQKNYSVTIN